MDSKRMAERIANGIAQDNLERLAFVVFNATLENCQELVKELKTYDGITEVDYLWGDTRMFDVYYDTVLLKLYINTKTKGYTLIFGKVPSFVTGITSDSVIKRGDLI